MGTIKNGVHLHSYQLFYFRAFSLNDALTMLDDDEYLVADSRIIFHQRILVEIIYHLMKESTFALVVGPFRDTAE